jgi:hypothetical protein
MSTTLAKYEPTVYIELAEKGYTNVDIADALGDVTEASVRRGLRKAGYVRQPKPTVVADLPDRKEVELRLMQNGVDRVSTLPPGSLAPINGGPDVPLRQAKQKIMTQIRSEANLLRQFYVNEMTAAANAQIDEASCLGYFIDSVQIPTAEEYLDGRRPRPNVLREWYFGPDGPGSEAETVGSAGESTR